MRANLIWKRTAEVGGEKWVREREREYETWMFPIDKRERKIFTFALMQKRFLGLLYFLIVVTNRVNQTTLKYHKYLPN